jgi:uncharacterized protein with PIN domain
MGIMDILKDIPLSAILKERLAEQEKRMSMTETENVTLKEQIVTLETKVSQLEMENTILKRQLETSHSQALDACPYCNQLAGVLQDRKRHELLGEAGVFTHFYQCSNCQKTYEKDKRT